MRGDRMTHRFHWPMLARLALVTASGMGLSVALLLTFAVGANVARADSQQDGDSINPVQSTNGTWGPGVITATADVTISPTVVITIAPNTTILVIDGVGFTVHGDLHSDGPITFTTASLPAVPGAWDGITYTSGSSGYLNEATVEYAKHGLVLSTTNPLEITSSIIRYNRHQPASGQDAFGAGITIISGAHLITNTQVYENALVATGAGGDAFGGGIDVQGTGSQIVNCAIHDNVVASTLAFAAGGGIAIRGDGNGSLIEGCTVTSNTLRALGVDLATTYGAGGGIGFQENADTRAVIRGNLIAGNANRSVAATGGGVGLAGGAQAALIAGNVIYGNLCESPGGSDATKNNYWAEGGGIDTWTNNQVTVTNNLILSNTVRCIGRCYENTGPVGGAMMVNGVSGTSATRVINNTVIGNRAEGQTSGGYGGAFGAQTYGIYANNIVVNNSCTANNCGGAFYWWAGVSVGYGDLWNNAPNNYAGLPPASRPGDIFADPLFADARPWGYHLDAASPALDAGTSADAPSRDFEGDPRPQTAGYDMGWDESGLEYTKHSDASTSTPGGVIQYTLHLTNTDAYSDSVVVSDTLDANLHWISGGTESDGTVVLSTTVPANSSVELIFIAMVDWEVADGTPITNTAAIFTRGYVGNTNVVSTMIYRPVLTVTKEAASNIIVGNPLTYTLHVSNSGTGLATNVVVTDELPANAYYVSGGTEGSGEVLWTIPAIAPGETQSVTFAVTTCQESLTNQHYRVITSTQHVDTPFGPGLVSTLTPPTVIADFEYTPLTITANAAVYFTSTSATDGSSIAEWFWDFGDGTGSGETATHVYSTPGSHAVTLVVTDACGYTNTAAALIEVYALLNVSAVGDGSVTRDPSQAHYSLNQAVTLTANADTGWHFNHWSGDASGSTNPLTVTVDADKTITATFERNSYTLTLDTVGSGSVDADPAAPYFFGDVVTLTANADTGWHFDHWSGDASGSTNPLTVTMDADKTITATFERNPYTLTLDTSGSGSVDADPAAPYFFGDVVTLTANADTGWHFTEWSGDVTGSTNPVTLTLDADKTVTATFERDQHTLTLNVVGSGSVDADPAAPYFFGDVVTLTASADTGWVFDRWSGDVAGSDNPKTITMNDNKSITAHFVQSEYALTITTDGSGSVNADPAAPYFFGDIVTLTANADTGWHFTNWSGDVTGSDNPATITIDGNKSITAHFARDEYTLAIVVVGSGLVDKNPDKATYHYGDVVTLTASPEEGSTFTGWDGDLSGSDNPATITMDGHKSVTAYFEQQAPPAAVKLTIAPDAASITTGESIAYTATAEGAQGHTWDVTAETTFNIEAGAGGSWAGNVYTSSEAGTWTVTGRYSELADTASLTVNPFAIFLPLVVGNY